MIKRSDKPRVAVIHEILWEYGGAERVLEEILEVYPESNVYTFIYNRDNDQLRQGFDYISPHSSLWSRSKLLQFFGQYLSFFKLISWLYFFRLDLKAYDLVIISSHSWWAKAVRVDNQKAVLYMHTPPRFLSGVMGECLFMQMPFAAPLRKVWKRIDKILTHRFSTICVNSQTVQERVRELYGVDSHIIYPPVKRHLTSAHSNFSKEYFIAHARLVHQKGIELIVKTCAHYALPLVVVGEGHLREKLEAMAGPTVQFVGWVADNELAEYYARAKALLYAAIDEDFGIVPVEALAMGVPVVAYASGGILETVRDGTDGVLFTEYHSDEMKAAIDRLETVDFDQHKSMQWAEQFAPSVFHQKLRSVVEEVWQK